MNFFKRRRFKFHVDFMLVDLTDIPLVHAVIYAKVRLLSGGDFSGVSPRMKVTNHIVCWGSDMQFTCKVASNPVTAVLEPCMCRVSIRKESRSGKGAEKLGFVDINLSEFAGSGVDGITKLFILEGYKSGWNRQDNSVLRVNVSMSLLSSDPFFKVPSLTRHLTSFGSLSRSNTLEDSKCSLDSQSLPAGSSGCADRESIVGDDQISYSSRASSSGKDSVCDRRKPFVALPISLDDSFTGPSSGGTSFCCSTNTNYHQLLPGHSRNPSTASQRSSSGFVSGSGTNENKSHSRQSSVESGHFRKPSDPNFAVVSTLTTNVPSMNSELLPPKYSCLALDNRKSVSSQDGVSNSQASSSVNKRMDNTRIDPEKLVNELIGQVSSDLTVVSEDGEAETSGLQLYVSEKDGTASVMTEEMKRKIHASTDLTASQHH